jgi:hypothetical protein
MCGARPRGRSGRTGDGRRARVGAHLGGIVAVYVEGFGACSVSRGNGRAGVSTWDSTPWVDALGCVGLDAGPLRIGPADRPVVRGHLSRRPCRVMCGCPRRCKRSLNGAGDDRVRSCVRPRSAPLSHAAGRYGDTQTRRRSKTRARSSLTLIAFPGLDLSDQFALTVARPPSSPTHQRKRLLIRPAPALILDILRPC